jgi:predicted dinucleotide-binding enzyme
MRIGIIGAGSVGRALGKSWSARDHQVRFGVRGPGADKYRDLGSNVVAPAEAVSGADAIVLATPWPATEAAVKGLGDLSGRILIDCTNPLAMGSDGLGLVVGHHASGAERVAEWSPGAAVFKTFNQTGAENMADPSGYAVAPAMFVAGDDAARKPLVMGLVRDLGFDAIDAGPLRNARLLEPLAMLWIDQALIRGAGRHFAFAVVRRGEPASR